MHRFAPHGPALRRLTQSLVRPQMLAFAPALALAGYWYGTEGLVALLIVLVPLLLLTVGLVDRSRAAGFDPLTGLALRDRLIATLDGILQDGGPSAASTIVIAASIDDPDELRSHLGPAGLEAVALRIADRILGSVRKSDMVARLDGTRFALVLRQARGTGIDIAMAASGRLQAAIAEPISIDASSVYVSASVGFCLARQAPEMTGASILEAAEIALDAARRTGAGSVRAYSAALGAGQRARSALASELDRAFRDGEIRPWFQPQIATRTGQVSGIEALVRWDHPERGVLSPADFMPVIEAAGQMERLGEAVLYQSLSAMRAWDRAGQCVPLLGLNLSLAELSRPHAVDRLKWELDRFEITADRIAIEIPESVVSSTTDETVIATVGALTRLGCSIVIDDFGTGHAALAAIRRFAVSRIKIDRSFVTRCDDDRQQRQMISEILSLAAELQVETIAKGVETAGEQALLAELGCPHVQGFAIARPMPVEDATLWLAEHAARRGAAAEGMDLTVP